jgi:hypothetical protein
MRTVVLYPYDSQLRPGVMGADFETYTLRYDGVMGADFETYTLRYDTDDAEKLVRDVYNWVMGGKEV